MTLAGGLIGAVADRLPPGLVRAMATRYAAGPTPQAAMVEVDSLNRRGMNATIAALGEAAGDADYAERHHAEFHATLQQLSSRGDLNARLGIKLTALGLTIDRELARAHLIALAEEAAAQSRIVEVDMEQHEFVDDTLDLVTEARNAGHQNVHAVVQAYLHRTPEDVDRLIDARVPTRIVRGAYSESPSVALQERAAIRERYVALVSRYLQAEVAVAIGAHDEYLIVRTLDLIHTLNVKPPNYEFQMIMGIQEALRASLVAARQPVRVTVSFGADMHLWAIRRIKENPEMAKYALSSARDLKRPRLRSAPASPPRAVA